MRYLNVRIGVRGGSERRPSASTPFRRSALAPFPLSMLFLFSRGDFSKIEWAENGARGRLHFLHSACYNEAMNFGRGTYTRGFLGILLAFFFLASYFGAVTIHTNMDSDGTMSGCAMPGMATLCKMDPLEHIATWQSMFTAVPSQNDTLLLLTSLLALALGALFLTRRSAAPPKTAPASQQKLFLYYKRHIPVANPLQEAFSNGILHPKIF